MNKLEKRFPAGEEDLSIEQELTREMEELEICLQNLREEVHSSPKKKRLGVVLKAFQNPNLLVREEAFKIGIDILLREERFKVFQAALKDPSWVIRDVALTMGVKIFSGKERLEIIRTALEDSDSLIRELALIMGVENLSGKERLKLIQIVLQDEDPRISNRAEQYLRFYYPKEYAKYIQEKQKLQESK